MKYSIIAVCAVVIAAMANINTVDAAPSIRRRGVDSQALHRRQLASVTRALHRRSGLESLTRPVVEGVANPLTTGVGRGVQQGAAQQDGAGDAVATLMHTLGGIAANAEQGVGVATANAAPAVQGTVSAIQHNKGLVGDAVRALTGGGSQ